MYLDWSLKDYLTLVVITIIIISFICVAICATLNFSKQAEISVDFLS